MKINPVKGTNDFLPEEMELRDNMQDRILKVYRSNGFERVSTPIIESLENLNKSDGGENLNLIFNVLKRGDKFKRAVENIKNLIENEGTANELSDIGLRYDLTLPLSRYFVNNRNNLKPPYKFIQIDRVYRAEKPQRGRNREFMQCDIDMIGIDSPNAEIELILTTGKALESVGITDYCIRINDRRILRGFLISIGFNEDMLDGVCITIDKADKVSTNDMCFELLEKGCSEKAVELLKEVINTQNPSLKQITENIDNEEYTKNLEYIIDSIDAISNGAVKVVFDWKLVRGQGYYTGIVFEIESSEFGGTIGGGGRYDNMIGKFANENLSAVGFSIGFERIYTILKEKGYRFEDSQKKAVVIYEKNSFTKAYKEAEKLRLEYQVKMCEKPKKLGNLLNAFESTGYKGFVLVDNNNEPQFKEFKN